mmetsp:Transcript_7842/g.14635  ORF Transcript_7842/g.14635 Transcript_7842/m.14635 type:complete len:212 (-) Transcript_7842:135-770(-)
MHSHLILDFFHLSLKGLHASDVEEELICTLTRKGTSGYHGRGMLPGSTSVVLDTILGVLVQLLWFVRKDLVPAFIFHILLLRGVLLHINLNEALVDNSDLLHQAIPQKLVLKLLERDLFPSRHGATEPFREFLQCHQPHEQEPPVQDLIDHVPHILEVHVLFFLPLALVAFGVELVARVPLTAGLLQEACREKALVLAFRCTVLLLRLGRV